MPQVDTAPDPLRIYHFHGVHLSSKRNGSGAELTGQCPFCSKDEHFYVNTSTGQYHCKVCGASGNEILFLRQLWEMSQRLTTEEEYEKFRKERKLLFTNTLKEWGVAKSISTDEWIIPGFGNDGLLHNLYVHRKLDGKYLWQSSPNMKHHTCGSNLFDTKKNIVYVAEGCGDGMALYEVLHHAKFVEDVNGKATDIVYTSRSSGVILDKVNVIAVPGANSLPESCYPFLSSRNVSLLYDNDHPKTLPSGTTVQGAGLLGMKRAVEALTQLFNPPSELSYLNWGKDGYDPNLISGYDVRDILTGRGPQGGEGKANRILDRVSLLAKLYERLTPIPAEWIEEAKVSSGYQESLEPIPCDSWEELVNHWRKALYWSPRLSKCLAVCLASIATVLLPEDQLWIKLIGPPSCAKSILCEAFSTSKKHTIAKSVMRGFHSGFVMDKRDTREDNSLLAEVNGKTLVTKDGDTLLKAPDLPRILSEGRDIYDGVSRTHYRNKISRDYLNQHVGWILAGTNSLHVLDETELGARFVDIVVVDDIDDAMEDDISWAITNRVESSLVGDSSGESEGGSDRINYAKRLTGGYIDYLCANIRVLLRSVKFPHAAKIECQKLAKFVAYMRARPSLKQDKKAGREMSGRLTSQLTRLALACTVIMNKTTVDDKVMETVRQVALDTSRGTVLELVHKFYCCGRDEGVSVQAISVLLGQTDDKARTLLRFLRQIKVAEVFQSGIFANAVKWRMTEQLTNLYEDIYVEAQEVTDE